MKYLALLLIVLLIVMPVLAQDATSPVEPIPEATPTTLPVTLDQPTQEPNTGNVTLPIWQLITFIGGAFLGGGALSIAGLGVVATKIMNNPAALKNAESVGDSVPSATANKLIELATSAIQIATLVKESLDHVPADTKKLTDENDKL